MPDKLTPELEAHLRELIHHRAERLAKVAALPSCPVGILALMAEHVTHTAMLLCGTRGRAVDPTSSLMRTLLRHATSRAPIGSRPCHPRLGGSLMPEKLTPEQIADNVLADLDSILEDCCGPNVPAVGICSRCYGRLKQAIATALAEQEATIAQLRAALANLVKDLEARWDMQSSTTNPGIRKYVSEARALLGTSRLRTSGHDDSIG